MAKDWYKFVVRDDKREIICISHYAGRTVKGVAKCAPNDNWDIEYGRRLAQARCDYKIAKMRKKNAVKLLAMTENQIDQLRRKFAKARQYLVDASDDCVRADKNLVNIINESK